MKKLFIIFALLLLALTSCVATDISQEKVNNPKESVTEERKVKEELVTPDENELPPVSDNTEEQTEETKNEDILPDETELENMTEEDLDSLFESITGGITVEFPIIPLD